MDMSQKILAAILAGFFLIALIRVFSSPFRLALKLLLNTLLGFLALGIVRLTAGITGIALGLNLWNALVIGVLGLPGFGLRLWVKWVVLGTSRGPGDRPPLFHSSVPAASQAAKYALPSSPSGHSITVSAGAVSMGRSASVPMAKRMRTKAVCAFSLQTATYEMSAY